MGGEATRGVLQREESRAVKQLLQACKDSGVVLAPEVRTYVRTYVRTGAGRVRLRTRVDPVAMFVTRLELVGAGMQTNRRRLMRFKFCRWRSMRWRVSSRRCAMSGWMMSPPGCRPCWRPLRHARWDHGRQAHVQAGGPEQLVPRAAGAYPA